MDAHETDPLVAGARELLEETGYAVEKLTHLARLSPNPSSHTNGLHVLIGLGAKRRAEQALDPGEDVMVEPTPWREAAQMALSGGVVNAQQVGLILMALAATKGLRFEGDG
jgi:8-oxo-dGTP pyrophosphatase MutT (NUDIX family)